MRRYRLLVSPRGAAFSLFSAAALVTVFGGMPFAGAYLFFLVAMVFPFLVQIALTTAGLLPALGVALVAFLGVLRASGMGLALYALCYLVPLIALMASCLHAKLPFKQTMAVLVAGYAVVLLALFWMAQRALDGNVFGGLTQLAIDGLRDMPDRDFFLNTFYRYGFLRLPAELAENPLVEAAQGYTFSPQVLDEFYKQAATRIDLWLRALLPSQLSGYSINWGVLGLFISLFYGARRAQREAYLATDDVRADDLLPNLGQPVFSMWYLPHQAGLVLFGFLGIWLLARFAAQTAALSLGAQMMYNAAAALFSIQGLSLVNFVLKKRDTRPRVRGLIMAIFYLALPMGMLLLGIWDQVANPRQLPRKGKEDNTPKGGVDI